MSNQNNNLRSQLNTQEVLKKDFLNIFEISHLFNVSGITVRRYIKSIFDKIELLEQRIVLDDQTDQAAAFAQELKTLSQKARKRVVGQTRGGKSLYLLELANKETFANWELRPTIKAVIQPRRPEESGLRPQASEETENLSTQEDTQPSTQTASTGTQEMKETITQQVVTDIFGPKYVQLLETQLSEKDATIKDLRETNKFLSITNGKLNEHLRFLLEKPAHDGRGSPNEFGRPQGPAPQNE